MTRPNATSIAASEYALALHQAVDWVLQNTGSSAAASGLKPGALSMRSGIAAMQSPGGAPLDAVLDEFAAQVFPRLIPGSHAGYMGYFSSSASEPAVLGELVSAAINSNCMLWNSSPGGVELEAIVAEWVRDMVGLPSEFRGMSTDGGSTSTFYALAAARHRILGEATRRVGMRHSPEVRIYCSTETHSSVEKAAIALGIGTASVCRIATADRLELDVDALALQIEQDVEAGIRPMAAVATIGTTSTGAVDDVAAIAALCARHGMWLHVDAAYGGTAALSPGVRARLAGWERADSIVINPHKWMFVPVDHSLLLLRNIEVLREVFDVTPEYLKAAPGPELNPMDYGMALGRRTRSLKLWFVIKALGSDGMRARVEEHLQAARWLAGVIAERPDFELLAEPQLSVVVFRHVPNDAQDAASLDRHNEALLSALNASGEYFLTHTRVRGGYALRVAINNYYTRQPHIEAFWRHVQAVAAGRSSSTAAACTSPG